MGCKIPFTTLPIVCLRRVAWTMHHSWTFFYCSERSREWAHRFAQHTATSSRHVAFDLCRPLCLGPPFLPPALFSSGGTVPCTIPYHTIPCHTIPYPYGTIPCHAVPYHTIPYRTIPYHTIPYHTISHAISYRAVPCRPVLFDAGFDGRPANAEGALCSTVSD